MAIFEVNRDSDHLKGDEWWEHFKALLDDQNDWPTEYVFKFIVPRAGQAPMEQILGDVPITVRASSKGKYVSITARMEMGSSDEVIEIYKSAGQVEGVVSL